MKASLTTTHDRLTIRIAGKDKISLNLTVSRRGETVSGRGVDVAILRSILVAFAAFLKGGKYGEQMAAIERLAENANDIPALIAAMKM